MRKFPHLQRLCRCLPLVPAAVLVALVATCDGPADPAEPLYRQAYDLTVKGKSGEARALYQRLLQQHPRSRFSADAQLALAELLFNDGDFDAALVQYAQVLRVPDAPSRGYALYKQGWCYLNSNQPRRALEIFQQVVGLGGDGRLPHEHRVALVQQARRDLVKAYARAGVAEVAGEYFQRWGGVEAPRLQESLAELYLESGRWAAAAGLFRELIVAHVDSPRLCVWQNGVVRAASGAGDRKEQAAELQRLEAVLARLERQPGVAAAELDRCRTRLRDVLKEVALVAHKSARNDHDPALLALADPLYRQYLTRFRQEKDAYSMTFFHAELLWSLGKWREAGEAYRRVVELDPRGKLLEEAAYAMVLAFNNAVEAHDDGRQPTGASGGAPAVPGALASDRAALVAAFELYLRLLPSSPEAVKMKYRWARVLYDGAQYERALPLLRDIVQRHPDDELAIFAANLQLDALHTLGRSYDVYMAARALLSGPLAARDREAAGTWRKLVRDLERYSTEGQPGGSDRQRAP